MKKILPMMILVFFIFLGISFLIFVLRMIWFPPNSMGMMMGKQMMMHHMYFWFGQTIWLCFIIAGVLFSVWIYFNRKKDK